jgi:hypothetical protein
MDNAVGDEFNQIAKMGFEFNIEINKTKSR